MVVHSIARSYRNAAITAEPDGPRTSLVMKIAGHSWWLAGILPTPSIHIDLELSSNIIRCKLLSLLLASRLGFWLVRAAIDPLQLSNLIMASSAAVTASAALKSRVARPSLLKKLAHPEDLIPLFPNGAYIGWSGFTGVGYPKYVLNFSHPGSVERPPDISDSEYLEEDANNCSTGRSQPCSQTMSKRITCRASSNILCLWVQVLELRRRTAGRP
jgi:hypothetical protein